MKNMKIFKLFLDTHMALGHEGLSKLATKNKVNLQTLEEGDLLMFMNKKGDKLKILGAQGKVIGYLRMPEGRRIMREALQYIPHTFGAKGFDYDAACLASLNQRLNWTKKEEKDDTRNYTPGLHRRTAAADQKHRSQERHG